MGKRRTVGPREPRWGRVGGPKQQEPQRRRWMGSGGGRAQAGLCSPGLGKGPHAKSGWGQWSDRRPVPSAAE